MKKWMFKAKIGVAACCVLALACLAFAGITAFVQDNDVVDNNFAVGGNQVKIVEEFDPPEKVAAGVIFTKDVKVKNNGPSSCFVRVSVVFSDNEIGQYCEIDYNTTDWEQSSKDGYWYYKQPVAEGGMTTSLFTTIKVKDDTPDEAIRGFDVLVYAESYQADDAKEQKPYEDYKDAWDVYEKNHASKDKLGPAITVLSPLGSSEENAVVVDGDTYTVAGFVSDQSGIASVTFNGTEVEVGEDGFWSADVTKNGSVTITATDKAGNTSTYTGYVKLEG